MVLVAVRDCLEGQNRESANEDKKKEKKRKRVIKNLIGFSIACANRQIKQCVTVKRMEQKCKEE